MNALSTVILGVLISAVGLILGLITTGIRHEFGELRKEFAEFRKEIKADLRATEQRLDGRIDGLQLTVEGMRSDLTQVALAVGVQPRASNG
jgi:CHASE1-domain containing sensor protein